jgi:hypothetical protein
MADGVLHFSGQFPESLLESVRNENWVVAESAFASRIIRDSSFYNSFEGSKEITGTSKRDGGPKSSATPSCGSANSRKLAK